MSKKIVHISSGHGGEFEVVKKIASYRKKKYNVQDQIVSFQESEIFPSLGVKKIFDEDIISIKSLKKLKKISKASEIVFYHNIGNLSALIWMIFLRFICKKKVVAIFHSNLDGPGFLLKRLFFKLRKYLIAHGVFFISRKVIFVSRAQRATFKKLYLFKKKFIKKSVVIHNFIDSSFISNKITRKKEKLSLLFVGRLSLFKGFSDLIKVVKKLISSKFEFKMTILGKGKLRDLVPEENNFQVFDNIENKDIAAYYDQCDVLVFPSYTESFGMVIIEAMARGLVILASDLPAIREIIKDRENGFLFPLGDLKKMEELIKYCAANPIEMEKIKKRNLTAVKNFTEEKQAEKYQKIYAELLSKESTIKEKAQFFINSEGVVCFAELFVRYLFSRILFKKPKHKNYELAFPIFKKIKVSIIIPVYNQWDYTYNCLASILKSTSGIAYEIIIADDNSKDKTRVIKNIVKNVLVIRNNKNIGFLKNCNNAALYAKGDYLLFLNNDTEVTSGWLTDMLKVIEGNRKVGVVGAKLLYKKGMLQEAGGIVWNNATSWKFGRLGNATLPQYNYVKEVDYVSGACFLTPRKLWKEIQGFSQYLGKAYFEDTDYCFKVREKGFSVIYQPKSEVLHYENVSYGNGHDLEPIRQRFYDKWKSVLQEEHSYPMQDVFFAKDRSKRKKLRAYFCANKNISECVWSIQGNLKGNDFNAKFLSTRKLKKQEVEYLGQLGVESIFPKRKVKKWLKNYKNQITDLFVFKKKFFKHQEDMTWNNIKKAVPPV